MNTPTDASDTQINRLFEGEQLAVVTARHRDLPMRVQIDPEVKVVELTAALAYSGLALRENRDTGDLWLTYTYSSFEALGSTCEHSVPVPDGKTCGEVCDDCNESLGADQAEGSVGK